MRMSAIFGAKKFEFFEIYAVSAQTRVLSQCGQGGVGQFLADVFYGRPLSSVLAPRPYNSYKAP